MKGLEPQIDSTPDAEASQASHGAACPSWRVAGSLKKVPRETETLQTLATRAYFYYY